MFCGSSKGDHTRLSITHIAFSAVGTWDRTRQKIDPVSKPFVRPLPPFGRMRAFFSTIRGNRIRGFLHISKAFGYECFVLGFLFMSTRSRHYLSRKLIDDPQGGNYVREKWKKGWSYQGRAESWYETWIKSELLCYAGRWFLRRPPSRPCSGRGSRVVFDSPTQSTWHFNNRKWSGNASK